ncbi:CorA family divalent cation transporter [Pseudochelatococcus sp. B33]
MQHKPLETVGSDTRDTMWLCQFNGTGAARWIGISEDKPPAVDPETLLGPEEAGKPRGFVWIHVDLVDARARAWINSLAFVPQALRQRFTDSATRHTVAGVDGVLNFSLPDSALAFDKPTDEMTFLHTILGGNYVITGRRRKITAVAEVVAATDSGKSYADPLSLVTDLVGHMVQRLEAMSVEASDELDNIEDNVLGERIGASTASVLGPMRRSLARIHRHTLILRQTLFQFERAETPMPFAVRRQALQAFGERLDVLDHDTVAEQARAKILQDEISTRIANESNRSLYIVTMVTTFFMPPALIAGIFGMNVASLPLDETGGGFWWSLLLLAFSMLAAYLVLRRFIGRR